MTIASTRPAAVLFDIDGTLLVRSSPHLAVIAATLSDRVGRRVRVELRGERVYLDDTEISGWVDSQIVRQVLPHVLGRAVTDDEVVEVIGEYEARFDAALRPEDAGVPVPGIEGCLQRLHAAGVHLGLVTGNAAGIARRKLAQVGLDRFFGYDPDLGFGSWRADRLACVQAAVTGVRATHGADAVVLTAGDTTADMRAAAAAGALGIGVLTGAATEDRLLEAGAWRVLPSAAGIADLVEGSAARS
ncbi:MAG TPA: HAD family hydrolase [Candidatus Limnocylindrales bacterium]|nr:HAD family hydrolase [Candidatus Limnocylindrales bacterium]